MVSIIGVSNANLQGCTIKQTFSNLRARSTTGNLVLAGPWELIYKLDSQDVSVELASNDKTTVNGEPLLIQELMISPIGYNVVFQTDAKLPTRNDERTYLPVVLTLKNGEEINLAELKNGGGSGENEEDYEHTQQSAFDTLIPIENMDYVTVGDKRYDISE
jgi:hypothetical protein